jgi:hypothetical protein
MDLGGKGEGISEGIPDREKGESVCVIERGYNTK